MKITYVYVDYSELRSTGHPEFGNKKYGVGYVVKVDDGEDARDVRRELMEKAICDVKQLHGDTVDGVTLTISTSDMPF